MHFSRRRKEVYTRSTESSVNENATKIIRAHSSVQNFKYLNLRYSLSFTLVDTITMPQFIPVYFQCFGTKLFSEYSLSVVSCNMMCVFFRTINSCHFKLPANVKKVIHMYNSFHSILNGVLLFLWLSLHQFTYLSFDIHVERWAQRTTIYSTPKSSSSELVLAIQPENRVNCMKLLKILSKSFQRRLYWRDSVSNR